MSAIVFAALFSSVLLLVIVLAMIKLRKYKAPQAAVAAKGSQSSELLDRHVTMILHMQEGVVVGYERPVAPQSPPTLNVPASWYRRLKVGVSIGFLAMLLITLSVQSGLADGVVKSLNRSLSLLSNVQAVDLHTAAHGFSGNASHSLVRLSQLDPAQYASRAEYDTWAYSACSTASMTEVFNAYGNHYRVTDVLKVESAIGEITPTLGLVRPEGIAVTAAKFGFKTTWGQHWTLDQLLTTANSGTPVIVSFPPDRYDGGHLLVVIGGNSTTVFLADSSGWNHQALSYGQFLQWWGGYAALVTPA